MPQNRSPFGQAGESPCEAVARVPSTAQEIRCVRRNGPPPKKRIVMRNDGSGLGLGSNEVAVVTEKPSSWTYESYLFNQSKVAAALDSQEPLPKLRKAPVFVLTRK